MKLRSSRVPVRPACLGSEPAAPCAALFLPACPPKRQSFLQGKGPDPGAVSSGWATGVGERRALRSKTSAGPRRAGKPRSPAPEARPEKAVRPVDSPVRDQPSPKGRPTAPSTTASPLQIHRTLHPPEDPPDPLPHRLEPAGPMALAPIPAFVHKALDQQHRLPPTGLPVPAEPLQTQTPPPARSGRGHTPDPPGPEKQLLLTTRCWRGAQATGSQRSCNPALECAGPTR